MRNEENNVRDEHGRVPGTPRRSPRRRGQSLVEYVIVMGMVAGLGFGTLKTVGTVVDKAVGKVTATLENMPFVKNAPRRRTSPPPPTPRAPGGAVEAPRRVVKITDCKHPRVREGECVVCHERM